MNVCENFLLEFRGYNLTASDTAEKIYVKAPFAKRECTDKIIILDHDKIKLLSTALNSKFWSSFSTDRYSLYDISFRNTGFGKSIGFSFNDVQDSFYMEPEEVFAPFSDFGISSLCKNIRRIQKSMFLQFPQYNPVFMIGIVLDDMMLTCVKSYIRFDLEKVPTSIERGHMIERMIQAVNLKNGAGK